MVIFILSSKKWTHKRLHAVHQVRINSAPSPWRLEKLAWVRRKTAEVEVAFTRKQKRLRNGEEPARSLSNFLCVSCLTYLWTWIHFRMRVEQVGKRTQVRNEGKQMRNDNQGMCRVRVHNPRLRKDSIPWPEGKRVISTSSVS